MNLLHRMNRELGANFDIARYRHRARYNAPLGRIEIFIESLYDQSVVIAGNRFSFQRGELLRTENSQKYTLNGFTELAKNSGLTMNKVWLDSNQLVAVAFLTSHRGEESIVTS